MSLLRKASSVYKEMGCRQKVNPQHKATFCDFSFKYKKQGLKVGYSLWKLIWHSDEFKKRINCSIYDSKHTFSNI